MKQTHRKHTPVLPVLLPLLLLGSGCGNSAAAPAAEPEESPAAESAAPAETAPASEAPQSGSEGNGTLIVYFSRTGEQYQVGDIEKGNTEIVAEMIAEKTGADLYEILPEEDYYPYTYDELTDIAKKEQNENARPAYQDTVPDLSQYSTVFIGAPVWWGDWPMIMYTFFENNTETLAGKTLVPFSTHGGSGLSGFDRKLAGVCTGSTIAEAFTVSGADAQNAQDAVRERVNSWLAELGY